jgi:hypothetical protein
MVGPTKDTIVVKSSHSRAVGHPALEQIAYDASRGNKYEYEAYLEEARALYETGYIDKFGIGFWPF